MQIPIGKTERKISFTDKNHFHWRSSSCIHDDVIYVLSSINHYPFIQLSMPWSLHRSDDLNNRQVSEPFFSSFIVVQEPVSSVMVQKIPLRFYSLGWTVSILLDLSVLKTHSLFRFAEIWLVATDSPFETSDTISCW